MVPSYRSLSCYWLGLPGQRPGRPTPTVQATERHHFLNQPHRFNAAGLHRDTPTYRSSGSRSSSGSGSSPAHVAPSMTRLLGQRRWAMGSGTCSCGTDAICVLKSAPLAPFTVHLTTFRRHESLAGGGVERAGARAARHDTAMRGCDSRQLLLSLDCRHTVGHLADQHHRTGTQPACCIALGAKSSAARPPPTAIGLRLMSL